MQWKTTNIGRIIQKLIRVKSEGTQMKFKESTVLYLLKLL